MQGNSNVSVSANAMLQAYYGEVLDDTLHQTLTAPPQPSIHSACLPESMPSPDERTTVRLAMEDFKTKIVAHMADKKCSWAPEHLPVLRAVASTFANLKTLPSREWGHTREAWNIVSHETMAGLLDLGLGPQMDRENFDLRYNIYSVFLDIFENVYFQSVMVFKPRVSSDHLSVSDPFYRQMVRCANMADPEIDGVLFTPTFNIKRFVLKCLTTLFPVLEFDSISGILRGQQVKVLRMVLQLFEYGLWTIDEMEELVGRMYQCSARLLNWERTLMFAVLEQMGGATEQKDAEAWLADPKNAEATLDERTFPDLESLKVTDFAAAHAKQTIQARILMAKIMSHIVAMHMDYEVEVSYTRLGLHPQETLSGHARLHPSRTISPDKVFRMDRMKKKRLYTYLSYVMVNYLMEDMPDLIIRSQRPLYTKLGLINSLLMAHATNIKADYCFNSLLSLDPSNLSFYMIDPATGPTHLFRQVFDRIRGEVATAMQKDWWVSGRVDAQFALWFSGQVRELTLIFQDCQDVEALKAAQLGCSLARVDHLLLSTLTNLLGHLGSTCAPELYPLIEEALDFLVLANKDNLQCVNAFFSFFVLKHFLTLYDHRPLHGAFVLMQLLRNRRCTKLFIAHEKVKLFVLGKFEAAVDRLLDGVSQEETQTRLAGLETLWEVVFLCKLTKSVIRDNDANSLRLSNQVSQSLATRLARVLQAVGNLKPALASNFDQSFDKLSKLEAYLCQGQAIVARGPAGHSYLTLWTLEQVLGLLSAATRNHYLPQTYDDVMAVLQRPDTGLVAFCPLINWQLGIKIFRKITKIYSNFSVFAQNSFMHNAWNKNLLEAYLVDTRQGLVISLELEKVVEELVGVVTSGREQSQAVVKLVYKGVLPMVFKFVCGILAAYTDERFKALSQEHRGDLEKIVAGVGTAVSGLRVALEAYLTSEPAVAHAHEEYHQAIYRFLKNVEAKNSTLVPRNTLSGKMDTLKRQVFDIMTSIVRPYLFRLQFFPKIAKYYKFSEDTHDNRLRHRMTLNLSGHFKFREEYKLANKQEPIPWVPDLIQNERHSPDRPSLLTHPSESWALNVSLAACLRGESAQDIAGPLRVFERPNNTPAVHHDAVYFYQQRYWALKSSLIDAYQSNQIYRILKYPDPIYKNIYVFVDYFLKELQQVPEGLGLDEKSVFSFNDRFQTLFVLADNLFRVSPTYRVEFLSLMTSSRYPRSMDRLWNLRQMLFDHVAYRTFINDTWDSMFTAYYLVSCFIQTLCENNFVPFKEFLCREDPAQVTPLARSRTMTYTQSGSLRGGNSLLAQYNESIQRVMLESEVHHKEKQEIDVRDRQDFTRVYCRAIEEINEYITGGSIDPIHVYKTRVDIWAGILFRREENPESPFYQTKHNVALYLHSFTESGNRTVMDFLSNKIFVGDVIDECVHMVWLLFRRETPWLRADYKPPWHKRILGQDWVRRRVKDRSGRWVQPIELESDRLVDLYKSNQNGFADHVIIDIIVTLFRFIKRLQQHDLRYSHYISSLEDLVAKRASMPKRSFLRMSTWDDRPQGASLKTPRPADGRTPSHPSDHRPPEQSMFTLNQVTCWEFMREVVCEVELQVAAKNEAGKTTLQLVPYQFKKHPVCFFDSLDLQNRFLELAPYGSLEEKQEDFVKNLEKGVIKLECEQANFLCLGRASWLVSDKMFDSLLLLMYAIVIVINILCLVCYNVKTGRFDNPDYPDVTDAVAGLTVADAALALWLVIAWFAFKFDTQRKLTKLTYAKELSGRGFMGPFVRVYAFGSIILSNSICLCLLLHLALSLLGFWSPYFYTLMLFLVLHFSSLLRGVVNAILSNLLRLFWTLVIIVIVLNFFSLILTKYYNGSLAEGSEAACDSYFSCLINTLNMGVVQDGGVSSYLLVSGDIRSKDYPGMFFTRLFAFILVNLFLLGMFFGIITDAFSEYVERLTKKDTDLKTVCFCCGLKATTLERYGVPFDAHVQQHSIFKYMYYAIYLDKLDLNAYSGIDYQVDKILQSNNKTACMPKYRAVSLEQKGVRLDDEETRDAPKD
jgi:hypothetical protein